VIARASTALSPLTIPSLNSSGRSGAARVALSGSEGVSLDVSDISALVILAASIPVIASLCKAFIAEPSEQRVRECHTPSQLLVILELLGYCVIKEVFRQLEFRVA
jgi:hypothetical protein